MVTWCKVSALLRAFDEVPEAEYFLWLDSDVYVGDAKLTMESLMDQAVHFSPDGARQAQFIVTAEPYVECAMHIKPEECQVNSGVMLIRNSKLAKRILQEWWNSATDHSYPCARIDYFRYQWAFEQAVMSSYVLPKYREYFLRLPTDEMNSPFGKFTKHYWGSPQGWPQRVPKFTERMLQIVNTNPDFADMRKGLHGGSTAGVHASLGGGAYGPRPPLCGNNKAEEDQAVEFMRRVLPRIQQVVLPDVPKLK